MPKRAKRRQILLYLISALCVVAIAVLVPNIIWDFQRLKSAASDNVQWTLSQTEVEGIEFQRAVEHAVHHIPPDLESVRVRFDIFYSRIETLKSGRLYAGMDIKPEVEQPLMEISSFLEDLVPTIDGPDSALLNALPAMVEDMADLRLQLRNLSTSGLSFFAVESDKRRNAVGVTLTRLGALTLLLIAALLFMLWRSNRISRQTEDRGREVRIAYSRANTILSTSLDAAVVTDMDGVILDFNPAAERVFQYSVDEVRGHSITDIMIPEHLRPGHRAAMERFQKTGEARLVGQGRVRIEALRRDGVVFPVELALEMGQSGSDKYIIAFVRDITHRVAAEKELVDARDKAVAGERAKAEFLAMMSHEIRTPLNGVLGNLTLLQETRLTAQQKRYVENMNLSGNLLMSHVDSVLDIARFEAGIDQRTQQKIHLGRKIQELVDSQSSVAEANGNLLEWSWVGAPVAWVLTDRARLQQVLLNLVSNAIKFTHGGRISIEVECVGRPGKDLVEIEIRVIDTGIGISEDDQDRIFEDFQMVGAPSTRQIAGTGLGLGIARRFVQAMGGHIGVESSIGEGSVFWVRVPMQEILDPSIIPDIIAPQTASQDVGSLDVLVVEDNEINLGVTREILESMGHQVTEARDGLQGVRKAETQRFDLILMDISMPVMTGLEATRVIRESGHASHDVPIIALSANVLPESRNQFLANGMSGFLSKPLRKNELIMVIEQHCTSGAHTAAAEPEEDFDEPDVFAKFRAQFREETDELFAWLKTYPQDFDAVEMQSHKIAGSAAAFDHLALRDALLRVEQAAHKQDPDQLRVKVNAAHALWKTVREGHA